VRTILFLIFCAMQLFAISLRSDNRPHVEYLEHFLQHYPKRLARAMQYIPTVEGHSAIHAIDPIIPVVVISCESAWKTNATGAIGERGLMQVHGACARGYDLYVPEQQIAAGIACLARARDECDGSLRQTLTMYQSGSCTARTKRTHRRINHRLAIIERWK
jgi:hypothetical protein